MAAISHGADAQLPPDLSRTGSVSQHPRPSRSKSLRARPEEVLNSQNATPRLPLRDSVPKQPELRPRPSKMSLFNVFSKSKVDKSTAPPEPRPTRVDPLPSPRLENPSSRSPAKLDDRTGSDGSRDRLPSRSGSAKSLPVKSGTRVIPKDPPPPLPQDSKHLALQPPPLFQALPRASRQGILEAPALNASGQIQWPKTPKADAPDVAVVDKSKKLFVLISSGCLLQYAADGPSDRPPEKVLHLGKHSAAFACDLIPGEHYVLHVSQAIDQNGAMIQQPESLFSKMGIRSQATKRNTPRLLLIFSEPEEMDQWMNAIRHEVEMLGGAKSRTDSFADVPGSGMETGTDLQKTPSQSHRYKVRRDPSKISLVTTPTSEKLEPLPPLPVLTLDFETDDAIATSFSHLEREVCTTGTTPLSPRSRAASDVDSTSSFHSQSLGQQQLDKLRQSRAGSQTSTDNTAMTSRPNSATTSPPSDMSAKGNLNGPSSALSTNASGGQSSSYTLAERPPAVPLSLVKSQLPANGPVDLWKHQHGDAALLDSPTFLPPMVQDSSISENPPQPKRLSMARSVPNLSNKAKHDSKIPMPPIVAETRESIVADHPPPSLNRAPKMSPSLRDVKTHQSDNSRPASRNEPEFRSSCAPSSSPSASQYTFYQSSPTKRYSPPMIDMVTSQIRHSHKADEQADKHPLMPPAHILEAKGAFPQYATVPTDHIPQWSSSCASSPNRSPESLASRKGSAPHIPSPSANPHLSPAECLEQSQSSIALMQALSVRPSSGVLRRPASLQIRTNLGPLGTADRTSPQGSPHSHRGSTAISPIRYLKTSRSAASMRTRPLLPERSASFVAMGSIDQNLADEASDLPTPLRRGPAPASPSLPSAHPPVPGSRKSSRVRSSLLATGFEIPLGPPGPPPQAPLPEVPSARSSVVLPKHASPPPEAVSARPAPAAAPGVTTGSP